MENVYQTMKALSVGKDYKNGKITLFATHVEAV